MAQKGMPPESLAAVRGRISARLAEIERRMARMTPADLYAGMHAIRLMAAEHGLAALEGLAEYSERHALLPGHRQATRAVLEHMAAALDSQSEADRQAILAAIALRIH